MKTLHKAAILMVTLALSACSNGTGGGVTDRIDGAMQSPRMQAFKENVSIGVDNALYYTAEGASSIQRRMDIARFPKVQPVIVRYGSSLAPSIETLRANRSTWDASREHEYSVELPNGQIFWLEQKGPQFHLNQMATLMKHGISVTLIP